jgi:predicted transcriptional regulator
MFSVRLPGPLVERIDERAEADGETRTTLAEAALEAELDRRDGDDTQR